jgi:hypothetical protein
MSHPSYLRNLFAADAAKNGGALYRRKSDVALHITLDELKAEVARRGFGLLEAEKYFIIICARRPHIWLV